MASGARKKYLQVMLVHAPLGLVQAGKSESTGLKMCDPQTGEPVKQVYVNPVTGEQFGRNDCGRAVEMSKGVYKLVPPDLVESMAGEGLESIAIESTQPLEQLPLERVTDRHWAQPDGGSVKALALVYEGLRSTGRFALAKAAVGTRERLVALVPHEDGLLALSLMFADQLKLADEDIRAVVDKTVELSELERKHAEQLMVELDDGGAFLAEARDTLAGKRESIIAAVLGDDTLPTVAPEAEPVATAAPDLDKMITESLKAIKAAKPKRPARKKKAVTA